MIDDYKNEETIAKIEKVSDELNDSFTYQRNHKANLHIQTDDDYIFSIQNEDETIYSNKNDFCDVTLACEDKHIKTHKPVISSTSPVINFDSTEQNKLVALERQKLMSEQVYNNIFEEVLKKCVMQLLQKFSK